MPHYVINEGTDSEIAIEASDYSERGNRYTFYNTQGVPKAFVLKAAVQSLGELKEGDLPAD